MSNPSDIDINAMSPASPISPPYPANCAPGPKCLDSIETLQTIGLTKERAAIIWNRFISFQSDDPGFNERPSLVSYVRQDIRSSPHNAAADTDDWRAACQGLGINNELTEAILAPQFHDIRLTEDLKYWVIDSLNIRYATLEEAHETGEGRTESHSGGPTPCVALSEEYKPHVPGYTILWKGLHDNGNVTNLDLLRSNPPTDFSRQLCLYFAVDKELAVRYARYARHRALLNSKICLLEYRIPNSFIENSKRQILCWSDNDFKHFVWLNRRSERTSRELPHLNDQDIFIGHIVRSHTKNVSELKDYHEITRDWLLTTANGELASQYCFTESGIDKLYDCPDATLIVHKVPWDEFPKEL